MKPQVLSRGSSGLKETRPNCLAETRDVGLIMHYIFCNGSIVVSHSSFEFGVAVLWDQFPLNASQAPVGLENICSMHGEHF